MRLERDSYTLNNVVSKDIRPLWNIFAVYARQPNGLEDFISVAGDRDELDT
jgi:hypothetical protein